MASVGLNLLKRATDKYNKCYLFMGKHQHHRLFCIYSNTTEFSSIHIFFYELLITV